MGQKHRAQLFRCAVAELRHRFDGSGDSARVRVALIVDRAILARVDPRTLEAVHNQRLELGWRDVRW